MGKITPAGARKTERWLRKALAVRLRQAAQYLDPAWVITWDEKGRAVAETPGLAPGPPA